MIAVYKQYHQADLNRQYNNRLQTPDFAIHLNNYEAQSRIAAEQHFFEKDISYGNHARELLDIFPANDPAAPVLVFIHGGYWRALHKDSFRFVAAAFVPENISVILVNYPLAPELTIDDIVVSCEKALKWIANNFTGNIFIAGHSAGGHLAAMLLTKEVGRKIKGLAAFSGIFNLLPIQLSDINQSLQMTEEMAIRNSPVTLHPLSTIPILVAVGAEETDEFKAQSRELAQCWKGTNLLEIPQANHYSIVELAADRRSELFFALLGMIRSVTENILH